MLTRPLQATDDRESFSSGEHTTDRFFHEYALVNHRVGISRVYVAVRAASSRTVLGFYTLSMTSVASTDVQDFARLSLPRYPMPAALIGQLAVDETTQGQRVGTFLLKNALRQCLELSEKIAAFGILVDALNQDLVAFYRRFGFEEIPPKQQPQPMFLPMATLEDAARSE